MDVIWTAGGVQVSVVKRLTNFILLNERKDMFEVFFFATKNDPNLNIGLFTM
jgi:hypothetical protein